MLKPPSFQSATTQKQSTASVVLSFVSYLALFVGTGFISGAIVHSGNLADLPKYIIIGVTGASLFLAGSFLQELILNKENLREEGFAKFFVYSLLLSIGIGMISGGTQHFTDFPLYSSYLVPLGLVLSLVAYLLKNNYRITKKLWGVIICVFTLIAFPLHFGLGAYASFLVEAKNGNCKTNFSLTTNALASGVAHDVACDSDSGSSSSNKPLETTTSMSHDMSVELKDDKTFIENMIPHHQEAIDISLTLLKKTKDTDLIAFANNVVTDQNNEISEMKSWYKQWYNEDYNINTKYVPMMDGMDGKAGTDLDKEYVSGMIKHHRGAVLMSKKVFSLSQKSEVRTMANNIVNNQNNEIAALEDWLSTRYNSTPANPVESVHIDEDKHAGH